MLELIKLTIKIEEGVEQLMALEQLSGGADPTPSIVDSGSTLAPSEGDSHSSCIGLSGEADCDLRGSGIKSD